MKTASASKPPREAHPHLGHLFLIGVLVKKLADPATRAEATTELRRYRDEGLILQQQKENPVAKKTRAHEDPPKGAQTFSGQGIIFAVIEDREQMDPEHTTTVDILTYGIDQALDAGYETPEEIARYLTTSAFQHIPDKRVRFNSVLKAGDVVGAQITRKLYNAYNELIEIASEEQDPKKKATIKAEATGFAEALQIILSPFSCEDPADPRLVNWDEVDRLTAAFEKEQRFVIRDRKGNPQ